MENEKIHKIQNKMEDKSSIELLDIWKKNDLNEWTGKAMEAIKRILISRNQKLPVKESSKRECKNVPFKLLRTSCPQYRRWHQFLVIA
ncbi:MAG: hypothetical protein ABII93_03995 [Chrysiogenia bacterium]